HKPFLNSKTKQKRLLWYHQRQRWIIEDWWQKFYSDEVKVEIGMVGGFDYVWHKPGTEM
ncbi:hypothetical protein L873DRAFT_1669100, partial [Choiromyces venosus 120613-1]